MPSSVSCRLIFLPQFSLFNTWLPKTPVSRCCTVLEKHKAFHCSLAANGEKFITASTTGRTRALFHCSNRIRGQRSQDYPLGRRGSRHVSYSQGEGYES